LDYFVKDHLGNVRMVLTEEQKTDAYPAATMESASATTEEALYSNVNTTRVDKPSGYPYDSYLDPHYKVSKVRGDGQKIGPGMVLKVMAGDKINLRVSSYWNSGVSPDPNPANPLNDLIAVLSGSIAPLAAGKASSSDLSGSSVFSSRAQSFLNSRSYTSTKPKAYAQWVFFDEQFKYISSNSGFEQVGNSGQLTPHIRSNLPVDKNGYVYVYVSNETTNLDVFFDNLQVTHIRGPLLSEDHFYPFGLVQQGISSKAAGTLENRKKFNGIEHTTDLDMNQYDAFYRNADPQIGRWWQIDPRPTHLESPYSMMGNNPMRYADFLGDTAIVFGSNGNFLRFQDDGKKKFSGRMITSETTKTNADGTTTTVTKYNKFKLNDGKLVAQAVKNGVINKVEFASDAKINNQIERSGVHSAEAQKNPLSFAKASGVAGGGMDYALQGAAAGDLNKNTLYVTGGVGYDIADFGNFLFGRGIGELGIGLGTALMGAQYNHIFNGRRGSDVTPLFDLGPGTYGKPGWFDASSDQQAIINGHYSSPRIIQQASAEIKHLEMEMKYGPKY
jgi:RHS repeat-associated protein